MAEEVKKPQKIEHLDECVRGFPQCPCNTCANDCGEVSRNACCIKRRKACDAQCPDYVKEDATK